MLHCATPDTASRRGLSVQSANVRSSIGVSRSFPVAGSVSLTRPILSRSIVAEVSDDIFGA